MELDPSSLTHKSPGPKDTAGAPSMEFPVSPPSLYFLYLANGIQMSAHCTHWNLQLQSEHVFYGGGGGEDLFPHTVNICWELSMHCPQSWNQLGAGNFT
jgi:hypothetical protein